MITHPVPQQISAFEYKLFGNLTVRQFAYVGTGGLLAFITFLSPLPSFLKLPLIILFAGSGAFAGLVPIQGRQIDKWLFLFIKAILSPTLRVWRKQPELPYFLHPATITMQGPTLTPFIMTESKLRLEEYLHKLPTPKTNAIDAAEELFLESLDFSIQIPAGVAFQFPKKTTQPAVEKTTQRIEQPTQTLTESQELLQPSEPVEPKTDILYNVIPGVVLRKSKSVLKTKGQIKLASAVNPSHEQVIVIPQSGGVKIMPGLGYPKNRKLHLQSLAESEMPIIPKRERSFDISPELKKRLGIIDKEVKSTPKPTITIADNKITATAAKPTKITLKTQPSSQLSKASSISQPTPPKPQIPKPDSSEPQTSAPKIIKPTLAKIPPITSTPNILSGIVVDKNNQLLENSIVLVKNEAKIPIRALKTNKLGQFAISTPLPNGTYTVEVEKEGYQFDIIEIQAKGEVIPAIEIRAK